MAADFWGRLFLTDLLAIVAGAVIVGISSIEDEKHQKSEIGISTGSFIIFLAALSALISAFGYIWTAK